MIYNAIFNFLELSKIDWMWDITATIWKKKQTWMIQSTLIKIFKGTQIYITGFNNCISPIALDNMELQGGQQNIWVPERQGWIS